ncbi:hypothetical protein [Gordonia sp. (in: high G+C Gram-positive bacteria)]|uniref:hypothetical protein n=1 Tax=Gordonia sp. (in: high G+C Gram-positive bacteria) TaxID=84139 RepID=UPI00261C3D8B|nr:hypothetical protein [Gordonia sp. (in: high G+C Gram-positive bacteria)]
MTDKPSHTSGGVNGFLTEHRELSALVRDARKFSVRLPVIGKVGVPQPRDLAMYAVLGGLAVAGVLEWPAAIGLAIGVTVAEQGFSNLRKTEPERRTRPAPAPVTVDGEVLAARPAPLTKRSARGPSPRPYPRRRR